MIIIASIVGSVTVTRIIIGITSIVRIDGILRMISMRFILLTFVAVILVSFGSMSAMTVFGSARFRG